MGTAPDRGTLHLLPVPLSEGQALSTLPAASLAVARRLDYFLAENAKSARAFLKEIGHPQPLQSLQIVQVGHEPDPGRIDTWLEPLAAGRDAAVVSEAGAPGVADPGAIIAARAHARGLRVRPLVGPSSILLALMASGLEGQRFRFTGYLPQEAAACTQAIRELERASRAGETQIFIETPYRNARLFEALLAACRPDTRLALAVDLTAETEYTGTRTVAQWRSLPAQERPALDRRPAIFCLLAPAAPR